MTLVEFLRDFWWLMFPVFGMLIAVLDMFQSDARTARTIDLIESYIDQGKEPPADLLKLAMQDSESSNRTSSGDNRAWSCIIFAALSAGLGAGFYSVRGEDWAFALLIGAVSTGVMAVGALLLLIVNRK